MTAVAAVEKLSVPPVAAAAPAPRRAARPAGVWLRWSAMAAIFLLFLAAWQWLPALLKIPPYILPQFSDTMLELRRMGAQEDLGQHFASTLGMTVLGFLVGSAAGAAGGYLLGMSRFWEQALSPFLLALQIAPKVAFAPLFIMWFGYTAWPKLLVTILVVFFPILVNVLQAMKTVDRDLINLARAYSLNRFQIFLRIELPASMPSLLAGLRIGATLAVIGVTVGELVGGNTGLGYLISFGEGQANAAMVFNAILLLTAIGIALYAAVAAAEARILHYIPRARS